MAPIYINQQASKTISKDLPVQNFPWLIAVGASAGGVETLKELLLNLPEQLINITVFIGFPIDKSNKQLLQAAIDSDSFMSLKLATQGEEIQPGFIYYCGPGHELDIKGMHLQLNITSEDAPGTPVDKLFESLSVTAGEKSIAVVLSGMGTDGAKGLKILKEAGGYVIVQSPPTARYNALPIAAVKTNCADWVISPFKIGKAIWDAVQLQPVPGRAYALKNEKCSKKVLEKTASDVQKNEATANSGQHFFPGTLFSLDDTFSVDTVVKELIFNCYEHTYLVVNSSFIIKEVKGDTGLFLTGLTDLTNQHLWSVISESIKATLMAEVAKATATQQVVKSSVELIKFYNGLYFIRIIVKPILNKYGSIEFYLIILENLQPEKFVLKEAQVLDTTWA